MPLYGPLHWKYAILPYVISYRRYLSSAVSVIGQIGRPVDMFTHAGPSDGPKKRSGKRLPWFAWMRDITRSSYSGMTCQFVGASGSPAGKLYPPSMPESLLIARCTLSQTPAHSHSALDGPVPIEPSPAIGPL